MYRVKIKFGEVVEMVLVDEGKYMDNNYLMYMYGYNFWVVVMEKVYCKYWFNYWLYLNVEFFIFVDIFIVLDLDLSYGFKNCFGVFL